MQKPQGYRRNTSKRGYTYDFPEYKSQHALCSKLWKTRVKIYIQVLIQQWDLLFPWKWKEGSVSHKKLGILTIISSNSIVWWVAPNTQMLGRRELLFSYSLLFFGYYTKLIFFTAINNLNVPFLSPECWIIWQSTFYLSVTLKDDNINLFLNLTGLDLRETVFYTWIKNIPIAEYWLLSGCQIHFHVILQSLFSSSSSSQLKLMSAYSASGIS